MIEKNLRKYLKKNHRLMPLVFPWIAIILMTIAFANAKLLFIWERTSAKVVSVQQSNNEWKTMYTPTYEYKCNLTIYTRIANYATSSSIKIWSISPARCQNSEVFILENSTSISFFLLFLAIILGFAFVIKSILRYYRLQYLLLHGTKVVWKVKEITPTWGYAWAYHAYVMFCKYNAIDMRSEVKYLKNEPSIKIDTPVNIIVDNPNNPKKYYVIWEEILS